MLFDDQSGDCSPLFGLNTTLKIRHNKKPGQSDPRFLLSLFDGLSPVRDSSLVSRMHGKYIGRIEGEDGTKIQQNTLDEAAPKQNSKALIGEDSVSNSIAILSGTVFSKSARGNMTPFKTMKEAVPVYVQAQDSSPQRLLDTVFSDDTPADSKKRQKWDLLAQTPATQLRVPGNSTHLSKLTPGDLLIFHARENSENESGSEECKSIENPNEHNCTLHQANNPNTTMDGLKSAMKVPPTLAVASPEEAVPRRVLFEIDSPPTPPMPDFVYPTYDQKAKGEAQKLDPQSPQDPDSTSPQCLSPRAELIRSTSKQLNSVMDMISTVGIEAIETSLLNLVATPTIETPPIASKANDSPPVYVPPASWTPLRSVTQNSEINASKSSSKKQSPYIGKNKAHRTLGPPARTPGRFRQTMISENQIHPPQSEVPSPFQSKTPLKRSPLPSSQARNSSTGIEETKTREETVIMTVADISIIETDMTQQTILMEQPGTEIAFPSSEHRAIKRKDTKKDTNKDDISHQRDSKNACIARASNFCDADSSDGDTEPLCDLINNMDCVSPPSHGLAFKTSVCKETDRSTDSARKYKALMSNCSDLLSEIETILI